MTTTGEVIGWLLLDDADRDQVLVRESNGHISAEDAFGQLVIQTGTFRCSPIIDPETLETLGYEVESLSHRLATPA